MDEKIDDRGIGSNWYSKSDTSEDIPDPNNCNSSLIQDANSLPMGLEKEHFQEGVIYFMTLEKDRDCPMLVMVMEIRAVDFTYRTFFIRGSRKSPIMRPELRKQCVLVKCRDLPQDGN